MKITKIISAMLIGIFILALSAYADNDTEYKIKLNTLESAKESFNVQDYTVLPDEKHNMYDADKVLRRNDKKGEAWVIYELSYLTEFRAESYHLPEDVAPMSFEISKDGKTWTKAEVKTETIIPTDNRWTKVVYTAEKLSGVRYLKAVWGEEKNLENWWNPYFAGIWANVGESEPTEINIVTAEKITLPVYDTKQITLEAEILDQIGEKCSGEIKWELIGKNTEKLSLSEDGIMTLSADMKPDTKFKVRALSGELSRDAEFVLCAPLLGDIDGDNKITKDDIDFIVKNFACEVTEENRLCDVDKNGEIDIIDLAYAARYTAYENEK